MSEIRGCNLPEDLYYLLEKHVWAKPLADGTLRPLPVTEFPFERATIVPHS